MLASFDMLAWVPGPLELSLIAIVALLFFGRRLPEVAKSMGKSIVEFKKGIKDVKDDIDDTAKLDSKSTSNSTPPLENKSDSKPHNSHT